MIENCKILLDKINEKRCCLISGIAGTGKSTLLKELVKELKQIVKKEEIHVVAPTGVACVNIGNAKTIHNWLGLKLADKPAGYYRERLYSGSYTTTITNLKTTSILIIDEISMITPHMFNLIDHLAKYVRKSSEPFGGITVIMFGDFCQLEPINKEESEVKYVFQTKTWEKMNIYRVWLRKIWRQLNDDKYKDILNRIREGKMNMNDVLTLRSKVTYKFKEHEIKQDGFGNVLITPPLITTHRAKVADSNKKNLLNVSEKFNSSIAKIRPNVITKYTKSYKAQNLPTTRYSDEQLQNMFPVYNVVLCEKAQVMMRCNEYISDGICNGTIGIVDQITPQGEIFVRFQVGGILMPPMMVPKHKFKMKINGGYLELEQFPLSLSYAISSHKAQGISLDMAVVDLRGVFCNAQAYVILSRIRSLDGLTIRGSFDTRKFKTCPEALKFETDTELIQIHSEVTKYMIKDLTNIVLKYLEYA